MVHDVVIVGGSYAGISAGLQIARTRRPVLVIDGGSRRNRFTSSAHGFLGQDGRDPAEIAKHARAELMAYPSVSWLEDTALHAKALTDGFAIELANTKSTVEGRRLILANGVIDALPEIEGIKERWGRSIFHCPYCHGYELNRGRIGVVATGPMSIHHGLMLPDWGDVTYFTRGLFEPTAEEHASLTRRGVKAIERSPVMAIEGGLEEHHEVHVRLQDERVLSFAGLFITAPTQLASPLATELGCAMVDGPIGPYVQTEPMTKQTSIPGVYACGDMAVMAGGLAFAVADGVRAGISAHQSLMLPASH